MKTLIVIAIAVIMAGCASQRTFISEKLTPTYIEIDAVEIHSIVQEFSKDYYLSKNRIIESDLGLSPHSIDRLKDADIRLTYSAGQISGIALTAKDGESVKLSQRQLYLVIQPTLMAARDIAYVFEDYQQTLSEQDRSEYASIIDQLNMIISEVENSLFSVKSEIDLLKLLAAMAPILSLI